MTRNRGVRGRRLRSADKPWHGMLHVPTPERVLLASEEQDPYAVEPDLTPETRDRLDLLRAATPDQIAAASRADGARTQAEIDRMWDRLRRAVRR